MQARRLPQSISQQSIPSILRLFLEWVYSLAAPSHTSQPVMHNRKPHASFDGGTKRYSSELMKSFSILKMYSPAIQQSRRQRNMQKHHHRKDPLTPGFPDPGEAHDHHPVTAGPDFPDPGGVHDHHLSTGNPRAMCNQHSPRCDAETKLQFVRRVDGDVEVEDLPPCGSFFSTKQLNMQGEARFTP